MYQLTRTGANKTQSKLLDKIEKFIRDFPRMPHVTVSKTDYEQLYELVPKECSKTETAINGVLIICQ